MSETNEPRFIEVSDLAVEYDGRIVLEVPALSIRRGRITAVIGPSGCGKTSFLQCINRLTDLTPGCRATGSIRFHSTNAEPTAVLDPRLDVVAHRRRVGMIFQAPNPFPMSIYQNVELALREHGVRGRSAREEIIHRSLRQVGLWEEVKDRLADSALDLSGGQQQRLCLARALALGPEAVLLDEPCSALDPLSSAHVEDLILSLRGELTLLVVTHNLAQARRIADDAAMFWIENGRGRLVESGPASEVFQSPQDPITAAYVEGQK